MKKINWSCRLAVLACTATICAGGATAFAESTSTVPTTDLPTYVVTARSVKQDIADAHADISVVTRKQIETMHMTSVEEALRTVPGVQFLNYGSNGKNGNLSGVRINGSKNVVILVDGVRVSNFQGINSGYFYASLLNNMDNIQRIEVLRGATSTLYGSNAQGGVINIITRKISGNKTTVNISGGSTGNNMQIMTMGKTPKVDYSVYYNRQMIGNQVSADGSVIPGTTSTSGKGTSIHFYPNDKHDISVDATAMDSLFGGHDNVYRNDYAGFYHSKTFTLRDKWRINEHWNNDFSYRYTWTNTDYTQNYNSAAAPGYDTGITSRYYFLTNHINFSDSHNNAILGIEHMKASAIQTNGTRNLYNDSIFFQNQWKFAPGFALDLGIRYDGPTDDKGNRPFGTDKTKSYKLSYDINKQNTIYGGRSDFFTLPSIDELFAPTYGNKDLKAARGHTDSLGYSHSFTNGGLFTFNWFRTLNDVGIGYDANAKKYVQTQNGVARGWNAQYMGQAGKHWSYNVGWAHLYQFAKGDNLSMGYYPKNMLTFSALYKNGSISGGIDGFYFMRYINPEVPKGSWPANNYGVYNLSFNYKPVSDLMTYIKINNITNTLWAEHTDVPHGGAPQSWYDMPGRNFSVGIEAGF